MERVALKIISPKLVDSPIAVERFRREVKTAASLAHPNIVNAYDADQAGELHFLVMEHVPADRLPRSSRNTAGWTLSRLAPTCGRRRLGLQHAHEQHRASRYQAAEPHHFG